MTRLHAFGCAADRKSNWIGLSLTGLHVSPVKVLRVLRTM
jgi:hypothetical protein